jgi:hypothetical protein
VALTRQHLIDLCERGVVPHEHWHNRDTAGAQRQLGEALALLRAGCDWRIADDPKSNERTLWVEITFHGFGYFDWDDAPDTETFYIPTDKRLREVDGRDWY